MAASCTCVGRTACLLPTPASPGHPPVPNMPVPHPASVCDSASRGSHCHMMTRNWGKIPRFLLLKRRTLRCVPHLPMGPQGNCVPGAHGGSELTHPISRGCLPFVSYGLTPLLAFPQFTCQISHLCSCPCLRVCYWRAQTKMHIHTSMYLLCVYM